MKKENFIHFGIGAFLVALFAASCWYAWYCGNQAYIESLEVVNVIDATTTEDVAIDINEAVATEVAEVEAEIKAQEEAEAAAEEAAAQNYTSYDATYGGNSGYSSYGSSSWSGGSAKDFIIYHESRGDYTATNGKYYGAYQLDIGYLNGDLSPENQDKVAEEYVNNRYGGWEGAMAHWQSNGWY